MKIARRPKAYWENKGLLHDNRNNSPGIWPYDKQYCLITDKEKIDRIKRLNRQNHNLWDFNIPLIKNKSNKIKQWGIWMGFCHYHNTLN